jgi:hypothetical protein
MIAEDDFLQQSHFFHDVVQSWLDEPDITVACGRWSEGAIGELLPDRQGTLLPAIYDGCFAGVRELRLKNADHHLHIDLGRVHHVRYVVAPSVCFGFRPSFEARLLVLGPGGTPSDHWVVSLMLSCPYDQGELDAERVRRFLELARQHARQRPDLVEFAVEPAVRSSAEGEQVLALLRDVSGIPEGQWPDVILEFCPSSRPATRYPAAEPPFIELLKSALQFRESSLVIYRDRTLIEFKTEKLGGLHRYVEHGHVSWQIGAFDDHHCHLALGAVDKVLFSAEPVSCQGGGINYTIWFLTPGPCGNPFRRDGYFSIVLNRPYDGNLPREEVIKPVIDLYRQYQDAPWIQADSMFLEIFANGLPPRKLISELHHAAA